MSDVATLLAQYAGYHQDRRNVATHFVGIPLIVVAVLAFLARPLASVGGLEVSLAWLVVPAWAAYYARLDLRLGLGMAGALVIAGLLGRQVALLPLWQWLAVSGGAFVVGWAIQFVGHWFEGKRPAFVDDLRGLAMGPLFLLAELSFALGLRAQLRQTIAAKFAAPR